jgi:uncharacterized protein (DUF362 family)
MREHTRRDFIVRSTAAGMAALGAESVVAPQARAAGNEADMAIAKWNGQGPPRAAELKRIAVALTEKAVEGIGGLKRFVGRGDVVWIKPNIAWDRTPELAANTNPDMVATLVRLCFEAGAKTVKVGDHPCDLAEKTYHSSGIADAARKAGAEVLFVDPNRFRKTAIGGERVKSIPVYPAILDCDLVINVPVVKHHGLATVTACMKNYMGVIDDRRSFHQALPECLADLTRFMKPRICVLDGIRILKAHGPKGGNPDDVELKTTVAAGVDVVALDAWGAELMGVKPADVGSIVKGQEVGLGTIDYRSLNLREISVS